MKMRKSCRSSALAAQAADAVSDAEAQLSNPAPVAATLPTSPWPIILSTPFTHRHGLAGCEQKTTTTPTAQRSKKKK